MTIIITSGVYAPIYCVFLYEYYCYWTGSAFGLALWCLRCHCFWQIL